MDERQSRGQIVGASTANVGTRRAFLTHAAVSAALLASGCRTIPQDTDWEARARVLLSRHSSVDIHSHPGRFFFKGSGPLDPSIAPMMSTVIPRTLAGMKQGQVTAAVFSTVGDLRSLTMIPPGALLGNRPLAAGEAYADHRRQVGVFKDLVAAGDVFQILEPRDVDRARRSGIPGGILGSEGADFLEGRVDRVDEARVDGLRVIGLVHYRRNELGDVQTAPANPSGLTAFGEDVVRRMNKLGLIIDLAHISAPAVRRVVEISTDPVLVSHVMISKPGMDNLRVLSAADAKLVASAGGVIGAWPAGIGLGKFDDYIDEILRLVDVLGVDHVAIGTDMDANFQPVFADYAGFARVPAALLAKGMRAGEVVKVMGGNFMRVFARVA